MGQGYAGRYSEHLAEGDSMTVPFDSSGDLTITVSDIDGDTIELDFSQPLSPVNPGGGINLSNPSASHSAVRGVPLELSTPSMDAGTNLTVTID